MLLCCPILRNFPASPAERAEYKKVRSVFASKDCIRDNIFAPFKIENPTGVIYQYCHCLVKIFAVVYDDMVQEERCGSCFCCSNCRDKCGCCDAETDAALAVLGLGNNVNVQQAEAVSYTHLTLPTILLV